jgi:hypothetical protein
VNRQKGGETSPALARLGTDLGDCIPPTKHQPLPDRGLEE